MKSADIIAALKNAKGEDKAQLLYALGSIDDSNANEYYKKLAEKPSRYFHYLCYARCEAVSDYAAGILENTVSIMTAFADTGVGPDGFNELMWTALNICAFKSSDRLFVQFERIGQHYEKVRRFQMDMRGLMFSKKINPFLANRASKWYGNCGETDFIFALNDMLICGITRNGDSFAEKISSLADRYPTAYARAGLFADFARDNGIAFDKYGRREFADAVLSVFSGIEFSSSKGYMLYSPVWFAGNKNKIYHSRIHIGNNIDIRWVEYLVDIAKDDEAVYRHFKGRFGIVLKSSYRHMSRIMLSIFSPETKEQRDLLREYFKMAAKRFSNEEDFSGLELCGEYSFYEIIMGISENICRGNNTYYGLCNAFNGIRQERCEKLFMLDMVEEYIRENDKGDRNAQRDNFFKEAQLFRERKRPRVIK